VNKTVIGVLIAAATTVGSVAFAQPPITPQAPVPTWAPPAAPEPPPPPQVPAAAAYAYTYAPAAPAPAPAPDGQWVYTDQYGWIWMPYSDSYTYVPAANVAYTYAYYPRFGWRWISSPWVLNIGPTPRWGRPGPVHFAWYGRPAHYYRSHAGVNAGWRARPMVVQTSNPRGFSHGRNGHHDHGHHHGHRR